jgi:hypothetical protein
MYPDFEMVGTHSVEQRKQVSFSKILLKIAAFWRIVYNEF